MNDLEVGHVSVRARRDDPETSHEAAAAFEADQKKSAKSVRTVIAILKNHGSLTDFEIRSWWPFYWAGGFSDSLPCKARHWARQKGFVKHDGYSQHQGRRVRRWSLGKEDLVETVCCPVCKRNTTSEKVIENIREYENED